MHGIRYVHMIGKITVLFGKVNIPEFTGPFVNIAKEVLVNGFEVVKVKPPLKRLFAKLKAPPRHQRGFGLL